MVFVKGQVSLMKGRHHTEESKQKSRLAHLGKPGSWIGKHHSEETKKKISEANKGKKRTKPQRNTGKKLTEEHRKKVSDSLKGRVGGMTGHRHSEETKAKILESRKRYKPSEETRIKMREAAMGEKSSQWDGGKPHSRYPGDWTETLRSSIKERDNYTCQDCGKKEADRSLDIHHKNENKLNNDPANLITLCRSCHKKRHQKTFNSLI